MGRRRFILLVLAAGILLHSCKKNYGILYKIFSAGYKPYAPLGRKQEPVAEEILGGYILAGERALLIEKKDSSTCLIKFMPAWLNEGVKQLEGFVTTLNGRKYLNVFTDDDNYLLFRLDTSGDSTEIKLLTWQALDYTQGADLGEWLKKDGAFPDTSRALYKLPAARTGVPAAIEFCKRQLRPQVRDLESFHRYSDLFPEDEKTAELREMAIERTVNKTNSVAQLYRLSQSYPEAAAKARDRARRVCTNTENCLAFVSYFPEEGLRDSMIAGAFEHAASEKDYRLLISKFPDNSGTPALVSRLYFLERTRCKNAEEIKALDEKYSSNKTFAPVIESIHIFDRIPPDGIRFTGFSWLLTKDSKEFLDRVLLTISETNRKAGVIRDVYVIVHCAVVPASCPDAGLINFRQSVNRAISIKKYIAAHLPAAVMFHFIPCASGGGPSDSLSGGTVRFLLDEKQAEEYKARFIKLCQNKKAMVVPGLNHELITDTYQREEELENYCCDYIIKKLKADKRASFKIIPPNFLVETCGKDLPEFEMVYNHFMAAFKENKIRRRTPFEFVLDTE